MTDRAAIHEGRQVPELVGVFEKIDRAKAHLVNIELECVRVARLYREAIGTEPDIEGIDYVWRVYDPPMPRFDFEAIVGDAIHNLRCAVDHLACVLVEASGNDPTEQTYFPILDVAPTPKRKGRSLPNIGGKLDRAIRVELDKVQPYNRDVPQFHQLWMLHRLDIVDKHRKLLFSTVGPAQLSWTGEAKLISHNPGPYEDGDELCRFRIDNPDLAADVKAQISFRVRLNEPEAGVHGMHAPVDQFVQMLVDYVEDWVLPRFVPFIGPRKTLPKTTKAAHPRRDGLQPGDGGGGSDSNR